MQGTMKCAIYHGIKNVTVEERPIPQIGAKDILVKNLRAGICGSDTGAWLHGGEPTGIFPGQQFGHEAVSQVVEKGSEVGDDINIGDIVFIDPATASKAGLIMADMIGAFSQYLKVEDAKVNYNVYPLGKDVDLDAAVLIEPLSVGTKGAVCTNPALTDHVVVLGAGTIGLSAAAGLIARGMKDVCVVDRDPWRLSIAKELGALTIDTSVEDMNAKLLEYFGPAPAGNTHLEYMDKALLNQFIEFMKKANMLTGKQAPNVDLYVDAAGAALLLQECFNSAKHGTKYSIVAVYGKMLEFAGGNFIRNEPVVRGSTAYDHAVITEVIDHIIKQKTPIKKIVTAKFRLDNFAEAIDTASKADHNIKVIIDYEI